jgi:taurine dioxygenase
MRVSPLSDLCGVSVEGVDLAAPRNPAEDVALKRLFDVHGLVVFRGQSLTKAELVAAGAPFGGTMMNKAAVVYDADSPGLTVISTRGPHGDVEPEDPDKLIGDLEWHTDQGYLTHPNRGKILYCVAAPEAGGMTGFIDGQVTYKALPEATKRRVEGLHVIQSWRRSEAYLARNRDYRIKGHREMAADRFPDVAYPLVYPHPVTGAKVLNAPPLWCDGVVELPGREGEALVEELVAHVREPRFHYWHRYREGDAVLWDNWRFVHGASGAPGRYVRTLWSITLLAGPQIGRELSKTAAA